MNKRSKRLKSNKIDIPQYGLGSWIKDTAQKGLNLGMDAGLNMADRTLGTFGATNVIDDSMYKTKLGKGLNKIGDVVNPLVGQAMATAVGGPVAGMAMNSGQQGISAATGSSPAQLAQAELDKEQEKSLKYNQTINSFNSQYNPASANISTFRNGGMINYTGQSHEGPDGGIPIDDNGNPSAQSGNQPTGLTEDKEVAWNLPDGNTFIFSDSLGYAPVAKRIYSKYAKRLGKNMEKTDPISMKGLTQEFDGLAKEQEINKEMSGMKNNSRKFRTGGLMDSPDSKLTPEQLKEAYNPKSMLDSTMRITGASDIVGVRDSMNAPIDKGDGMVILNPVAKKLRSLAQTAVSINPEIYTANPAVAKPNDFDGYNVNYNNFYNSIVPKSSTRNSSGIPLKPEGADLTKKFKLGGNLPKYTNSEMFDPILPDNFGEAPSSQYTQEQSPEVYKGNNTMDYIGAGASMLGNTIQALTNKRPGNIRLARVTPRTVNLDSARTAMQDEARNTKVNLMRGMPSDAGYRANVLKGVRDINQDVNKNILGSYTQEAMSNAGLQSQADSQNAELQSQESLINAQRGEGYQNTQNAYKKAIMQAPIDAISRTASRENMWDMAQLNENYDIVKNPKTGRIQFIPKKK